VEERDLLDISLQDVLAVARTSWNVNPETGQYDITYSWMDPLALPDYWTTNDAIQVALSGNLRNPSIPTELEQAHRDAVVRGFQELMNVANLSITFEGDEVGDIAVGRASFSTPARHKDAYAATVPVGNSSDLREGDIWISTKEQVDSEHVGDGEFGDWGDLSRVGARTWVARGQFAVRSAQRGFARSAASGEHEI
jgi:hypothetical protein